MGCRSESVGIEIVAGELLHSERPEKMGYPIAGVQEEGEDGAAGRLNMV